MYIAQAKQSHKLLSYLCHVIPPLPLPTWLNLTSVLPLLEVAEVDGLVKVHVLFSLSGRSQIEKELGSYTSSTFIKEFQHITQSCSLTFHHIDMILINNLLPEEHR